MQLVKELQILINANVKAKAASLRTSQQRFLANIDSCISCEVAMLDLINKATHASLCQLIMTSPTQKFPTNVYSTQSIKCI